MSPQVLPRRRRQAVPSEETIVRQRCEPREPHVAPEPGDGRSVLLPDQHNLDHEPVEEEGLLVGKTLERNLPEIAGRRRQQMIEGLERGGRQKKIDVRMRPRPTEPESLLRPSAEEQTRGASVAEPAHDIDHARYGGWLVR